MGLLGVLCMASCLVGCGSSGGEDELGDATSESATDTSASTTSADTTSAGTTSADTTSGDTTSADTTSADTNADATSTTGEGECPTWCPTPGTSWQWQLTGTLDTRVDVEMYDIDLFDTSASTIATLHEAGRIVVCYFSAGSHEDWRPDAGEFPPAAIGDPLDGWPGERWLDIRDPSVRALMAARLDLALAQGCDGVEPDNVDGWANPSGFDLSGDDQLDYNRFLADQAHARGLSVGLKNDLDQIPDLVGDFDWALDEECLSYDECDLLAPFVAADKAVFHVEYVDSADQAAALANQVCPAAPAGFSTLIKVWDLDAFRLACP